MNGGACCAQHVRGQGVGGSTRAGGVCVLVFERKKKQKNSFPVHPASIQVIVHVLCVLRDP